MNRTLALGLLVLMSCFSTIPWTAKSRAGDPVAELEKLLNSPSLPGCVAKGTASADTITFQFICSQSAGSSSARLKEVKTITVEKLGKYFRVVIKHTTKRPDMEWYTAAEDDAVTFADYAASLANSI